MKSIADSNVTVTEIKTYINGVLTDRSVFANPIQYYNTPYFYIGTNVDGRAVGGTGIREFPGIIDEIRISKVALEPDQFHLDYLSATPGANDYSFVKIGETGSRTLKLFNTSSSKTMSIDSITFTDPDFTYSGTLTPILPLDSLLLTVTFTPSSSGFKSAEMSLYAVNSEHSPTIVHLSGIGYSGEIDTNVVADWAFDEGTGNFSHDISIYGNHGKNNNTMWSEGREGNALHFDGRTSYVAAENIEPLHPVEEFTIEAWVKPDGLNNYENVLCTGGCYSPFIIASSYASRTSGGYELGITTENEVVFQYNSASPNHRYSSERIPLTAGGIYVHVAATYQRSVVGSDTSVTVKIYLNGELKDSSVFTKAISYHGILANSPFYIGTNYAGMGWMEGLPASLDRVRISKVALQPAQFDLKGILPTATAMEFGDLLKDTSASKEVTIINVSFTDTATVTAQIGGNAEFTVDTVSFTIPPRDSQTVQVTYAPVTVGIDAAVAQFTVEDTLMNPVYISLRGVAHELFEHPVITSVSDIPNDQGRFVRVSWYPSKYDSPSESLNVNQYSLWRKVDDRLTPFQTQGSNPESEQLSGEGKPRSVMLDGEMWDFVTTIPAVRFSKYSTVTMTLYNTSYYHTHWSTYRLAAHAVTGELFFSDADSGYSTDDTYPLAPRVLTASPMNGRVDLQWTPPGDPDILRYKIYRSITDNFTPANDNLIGTSYYTWFSDHAVVKQTRYYYAVTSIDSSGNESEIPARAGAYVVLHVDEQGGLPTKYALSQNYPNPFNPVSSVRYQLPAAGYVTLKIYNILGEEVATAVEGLQEAGYKTIHIDASGLPSGVYFYRLVAGSFTATRKMMILK